MFGLLKDKLSGFIKNLTARAETKEPERKQEEAKAEPKKEIIGDKPAPKPEPGMEARKEAVIPEEKRAEPRIEAEKDIAIVPAEKAEKKKGEIPSAPHVAKAEVKAREEPKIAKKAEKVAAELDVVEKRADASKKEKRPIFEIPFIGRKKDERAERESPHRFAEVGQRPAAQALVKAEAKKEEPKQEIKPAIKPGPRAELKKEAPKPEARAAQKTAETAQAHVEPKKEHLKTQEPVAKPAQAKAERLDSIEKMALGNERKPAGVRLGLGGILRSFISSEVEINESDVKDLLDELELSLLESDVAYEVALDITSEMRSRLVGRKVPKGKIDGAVKEVIRESIAAVMTNEHAFDIVERCRGLKPAKILFVGPNGAGKTTTMAKVASMLEASGMSVVFSASDTFRAAAIEQLEEHGRRLGIRVIKGAYGSDPAAVAFDSVNFARSHAVDVVLIDSAGRQDTNANLLDELRKMKRVISPDMRIYVGESIAGNALIDQVRSFHETVGLDGVILTKLDCDAKGGTALSVSKATGVPIIYVGTGQKYSDLRKFVPGEIAGQILGG